MIGRSGERGSGISVLAARHDDDDDDDNDRFLRHKLVSVLTAKRTHRLIKKESESTHAI